MPTSGTDMRSEAEAPDVDIEPQHRRRFGNKIRPEIWRGLARRAERMAGIGSGFHAPG